ncbi:hypothetical protein [Caproicibacter sp. BJN0012]|uniref:hypothetical protein n=1 Tax=Caproicibacter sp. BJN0012 TaxID=3110227 RepID=UPI002E124928
MAFFVFILSQQAKNVKTHSVFLACGGPPVGTRLRRTHSVFPACGVPGFGFGELPTSVPPPGDSRNSPTRKN